MKDKTYRTFRIIISFSFSSLNPTSFFPQSFLFRTEHVNY